MLNSIEAGTGPSTSVFDSSPRPGDLVPYSYEGVADSGFKKFMEGEFEIRLQQRIFEDKRTEKDWRIRSTAEEMNPFLTILGGKDNVMKLIEYVITNNVIKFISEQQEGKKKSFYYFNADMLRVLAALSWQSKNYQGSYKGKREAAVASAREALGTHSLADLIHDPVRQEAKTTSSKEESSSVPVQLDFAGPFWKTPLGEAVKEFAEAQNETGLSSSMTTLDVAKILKLGSELRDGRDNVSDLVRSGLLIGVEKGSNGGNRFRFEHVLLAGLIFIYIEKGYSKAEAIKNLRSMLEGTTLIHYLGEEKSLTDTDIIRRKIFAADSPWKNFPLEQKRSRKKWSKVWRGT